MEHQDVLPTFLRKSVTTTRTTTRTGTHTHTHTHTHATRTHQTHTKHNTHVKHMIETKRQKQERALTKVINNDVPCAKISFVLILFCTIPALILPLVVFFDKIYIRHEHESLIEDAWHPSTSWPREQWPICVLPDKKGRKGRR